MPQSHLDEIERNLRTIDRDSEYFGQDLAAGRFTDAERDLASLEKTVADLRRRFDILKQRDLDSQAETMAKVTGSVGSTVREERVTYVDGQRVVEVLGTGTYTRQEA